MTAKFRETPEQHRKYIDVATDRERVAIEALLEHGNGPAAAAAAGISLTTLHQRLTAARHRWALRQDGALPPPDGFRVTKVAQRGDGTVIAVQSKPEAVADHHDAIPDGHAVRGVSTLYGSDGTITAQWVKTDRGRAAAQAAFEAATELHVRKYSALAAPVQAPVSVEDDLETWYPIGDPHLGLLAHHAEVGVDSDLKIASQILYDTVDMLVSRSPASATGVVCSVGDYFHSDSNLNRTQSGHQLDVDSRHAKVAEVGFSLMRRMIERALTKHARVLVVNAPGNHAPTTEKMMGLWLKAVFEREPRVEVLSAVNPYIYHRFGSCLIGVHHGDGAKAAALPEIMACDRPEDWGQTTFRAWYTGHIHHDSRRDYRGCTVESFRTMASADAWSHHAGYRSGRSLQAITLHRQYGEQGRVTVGLREVAR